MLFAAYFARREALQRMAGLQHELSASNAALTEARARAAAPAPLSFAIADKLVPAAGARLPAGASSRPKQAKALPSAPFHVSLFSEEIPHTYLELGYRADSRTLSLGRSWHGLAARPEQNPRLGLCGARS